MSYRVIGTDPQTVADTVNALMEIFDSIPACDFHEREWCTKGRAKWIGRARHECGAGQVYLICEHCKDFFIQTEDGFECGKCGEAVFPARRLWSSFESINP